MLILDAETEKDPEANTNKNIENINVSEQFLAILKSSYEVKCLYEENKNSKMAKKMLSAVEVTMKDLFQNVTTSTETGFDDIIVLAIAYYKLGELYFYEHIRLDVAIDHFTRCIELLNGKELNCKAILTILRVHIGLNYIWRRLEKTEKCYPLLDKAMELYLNYTKEEDEYPYPIDIATIFHIHNFSTNTKIQLTELHIITLELLVEQYLLQPRDKHKFVIYVHNLLKKELIEAFNLDKTVSMFWPVASANLCIYFVHHNRFIEARNHLETADYILEMYYKSMIKIVDGDDLIHVMNDYEKSCANVAIFWGMYGVFLLRSSIEKLQCEDNRSCEMNNINSEFLVKSEKETKPLIFALKEAVEHIEIPNTHASNLNDAKIILATILRGLNIAKRYYTVDRDIITHVEIILHISLAYKYYAYFVEDKSKVQIIKQRIKILENAINNLILRCNTVQQYDYCRQLYFELAIVYGTLLNMTSEKLNEIEEITDEMRMETKQLVKNILDNFTLYLKNT